jgi:UDP-3-O-acyl-N-acetylglucosamine deacetylase
MLDLLGDLALVGAWPQCEIVAVKSGHALHARMSSRLRERLLSKPLSEVPTS